MIALPPTKTRKSRGVLYASVTPELGVMEIHEDRSVSRYAVRRGGDGIFVLFKPAGAGHHSSDGTVCSCDGFSGHGHCKHLDGLRALLSAGRL